MLEILRRLIGENIELVWEPTRGSWNVTVDPTQLDQILANLAANARDAIAGVGTLTIETSNQKLDESQCLDLAGAVPGEYVRLAVTDTGSGMSTDTLAHIFEPFFTTKGVGQGTGLGLATVYGVVQQNGGSIRVESQVGKGTRFELYFPRTAGDPEAAPSPERAPQSRAGGETILVVEDEEELLHVVSRVLERAGYRTLVANRPEVALQVEAEQAGPIDLLVTDLVMPGMNGYDLAKELCRRRPRMKCLCMSGYPAQTVTGTDATAVHLLQKPFGLKSLEEAVREVLDHPTGPIR